MIKKLKKIDKKELLYRQAIKKITLFIKKNLYLIVGLIALLCLLPDMNTQTYFDSDSYMWATRVQNFILNPSFFEQPIYQSNYPFGEILHFTKPFELVYLLFTIPFLYMDNLKDIIFEAGKIISPTFGILSTIALAYGLRRHFNIYLVLLGILLFLYNPITEEIYNYRFPDHQSLSQFLNIYAISATLCWLKKRHNRYLRLIGFTTALSAYTVLDGIFIYLILLSFFVYLYIFKNLSLVSAVKISKYYAISSSIFLILNPPYEGWLYPDNNRLSILFVFAYWLIFASLYTINLIKLHTVRVKITTLLCFQTGAILTILLTFGINIISLPLDERIAHIWRENVTFMRSFNQLPLSLFLYLNLLPYFSILLNIYLIKYKPYKRLMILNLIIGLPLFIATQYLTRFSSYQILYTITPFLCLIDMLYKKSDYAKRKSKEFPSYIYATIIAIFLAQHIFQISYLIYYNNHKTSEIAVFRPIYSANSSNNCIVDAIPSDEKTILQNKKDNLEQKTLPKQPYNKTLLTDIFLSTMYSYTCSVNTVGTAYHKNVEGIIDNFTILNSKKDDEIIPLLLKHQVTEILLFEGYVPNLYPMQEEHREKLYFRLIKRENVPYYLQEIPTTNKKARLYQVKI